MSKNAKIALIFTGILAGALAVALIVIAVTSATKSAAPQPTNPSTSLPSTFAENTRVLDDTDDRRVVLVEFLDFECEACGAFYPYVEQLRKEFEGEVTFAYRYFPLPSHGNSVNAAVAVEAAARQDQLEPMFNRMFQTQTEWAEKGAESQAPLFRTYAEEIGLDMQQYDKDVADPEVLARVQFDVDAGVDLGVNGTPTFFLNDRKVELETFDDLRQAIVDALAAE